MNGTHPLWDRIAVGDIEKVEPKGKPYPILILTGRMRGFVVKRIKAPLQRALEQGKNLSQILKVIGIVTARMPLLTKRNMLCQKTALMGQIEARFFEYAPIKQEMFRGAFKLLKFEIEHDGWYQGVYDFLLEQHIMMILTGEWSPRWENIPFPQVWNEPRPYGGEYTITYAMQKNREKIIDLLGEDWQWLKESRYEFNPTDNREKVSVF